MEPDDTENGGGALSIEQAASAFVKATSQGADKGQPVQEQPTEGEEADEDLQASDEDEGEDSGETDDDSQAEEEDGQEPETDQGRFVAANGKVKLPDGSVLTVSELINGNLRDRDYRQKTMSLSEERRSFEEQSSVIKASEQQVNEQRAYMASLLQSIMPQAPDVAMLDTSSPKYDPLGYVTAKEHHDNWISHLNHLHQQSEAAKQQAEQKTAAERKSRANSEGAKLLEKMPALRDQAKLNSFAATLQSAGAAHGFSPQEIAESVPYDHRMAMVLHKAALWDKLQANKPKAVQPVEGRPPVQKSGKRLTPDAQKARRAIDAVTRLKQSGTVADAAAAYLASRKG